MAGHERYMCCCYRDGFDVELDSKESVPDVMQACFIFCCPGRADCDCGLSVDVRYRMGLPLPVIIVVLDYAKRVDQEVGKPQTAGRMDSISESRGQGVKGNPGFHSPQT